MKPQQGSASSCSPIREISLPASPCAAWLLHNTDSISWKRPQLPGDCCVGDPAHLPALAFLLSTLVERTKCGRKNILMYECQQLTSPGNPLSRTWLCFPASRSKSLTGFLPNRRETGNRKRQGSDKVFMT